MNNDNDVGCQFGYDDPKSKPNAFTDRNSSSNPASICQACGSGITSSNWCIHFLFSRSATSHSHNITLCSSRSHNVDAGMPYPNSGRRTTTLAALGRHPQTVRNFDHAAAHLDILSTPEHEAPPESFLESPTNRSEVLRNRDVVQMIFVYPSATDLACLPTFIRHLLTRVSIEQLSPHSIEDYVYPEKTTWNETSSR